MEKNNETSTAEYKFRTYFDNNILVMKDKAMLCILLKLLSLYQLNYNKAKKHGKPTENVRFQFSLSEFTEDVQMSRNTVIEKINYLEKKKLITKTKTKNDFNANSKNEYQFHTDLLEEIVSKLNSQRRKERKKYINQTFPPIERKTKEKQVENENEKQEENLITSTPVEDEKAKNIKNCEALSELQRQHSIELMAEFQEMGKGKMTPEINSNKAIGSTSIQKPTLTTTEKMKIRTSENKEGETQSISEDIDEDEKEHNQLVLINTLNNEKACPFSNEFKSDKIFSKIINNLESKDYHLFLIGAFSETGFYTLSNDYLNKFDQRDGEILKDFIEAYKNNI